MEMGRGAFLTKGNPKHTLPVFSLHLRALSTSKKTFPEDKTTIWCALSIDDGLNEHKSIVPGFGDAGDLCYGSLTLSRRLYKFVRFI